jgi:hypothetical protein
MGSYSFTFKFSAVFLGAAFTAGVAGCVSRGTDLSRFYQMPGNFSRVNFAILKAEVLEPSCISCHSEMETEEGTRDYVIAGNPARSSLYTDIITGSMPPSGPPLSAASAEIVSKYIMGLSEEPTEEPAEEPSPEPSVEPNPDPSPSPVTYQQLKKALLDSKCNRCHEELETEEGMKQYMVPGNPDKSSLYTTVRDGEMPPRKQLPPDEVKMFRDYVLFKK